MPAPVSAETPKNHLHEYWGRVVSPISCLLATYISQPESLLFSINPIRAGGIAKGCNMKTNIRLQLFSARRTPSLSISSPASRIPAVSASTAGTPQVLKTPQLYLWLYQHAQTQLPPAPYKIIKQAGLANIRGTNIAISTPWRSERPLSSRIWLAISSLRVATSAIPLANTARQIFISKFNISLQMRQRRCQLLPPAVIKRAKSALHLSKSLLLLRHCLRSIISATASACVRSMRPLNSKSRKLSGLCRP